MALSGEPPLEQAVDLSQHKTTQWMKIHVPYVVTSLVMWKKFEKVMKSANFQLPTAELITVPLLFFGYFVVSNGKHSPTFRKSVGQGWRTYGTRHSLLSYFFLFLLPEQRLYFARNMCKYTHMWVRTDCIWITVATKITLQSNIFTQIGSAEKCWQHIYIYINGVPAWRCLAECVTLDKMFCNPLFKREVK